MVWRADDPQGGEADKVKYEIVPYTRGAGLDLGCGPRKAFPHFIGVDSCKDNELFGANIRPDVRVEEGKPLADYFHSESLDFVFSSHLLEHIVDYRAALADWWSLIKPGGHLVLYLPHADHYPRMGQPGSNPDHKHDFHPRDIVKAMQEVGSWTLLINETRTQEREYSFLQVYRKAAQAKRRMHVFAPPRPGPKGRACVVRYGAFGDMIQAATIFPGLKAQGFHLTVMTTPKGQDIIAHDPNVDDWFIQDNNQVPNFELSAFWAVQSKHYERFVNLSESVEGTLLAMPGRANHAWPDAMRRKYLNLNYLEFTAELAGVPYRNARSFYPTAEEVHQARARMGKHGGRETFHILFALSGSSTHKYWQHQDDYIKAVLLGAPMAHVYLVGDDLCKILEMGWENEPRVSCLSGEMSIRDTLTLAQECDLVIGPETGVLNSVAFHQKPAKIILLSHSSVDNLTKHWLNTLSMIPSVPCYPCHRLHFGADFCRLNEQFGGAECALSIRAVQAVKPTLDLYHSWMLEQKTEAA